MTFILNLFIKSILFLFYIINFLFGTQTGRWSIYFRFVKKESSQN